MLPNEIGDCTEKRTYSRRLVEAVVGVGVLAICTSIFYRVRELLAAFIIFSVVFGVVAIAFLILWLVERGAREVADRLETQVERHPLQHRTASSPAHSDSTFRNHLWH
jgi:hypothetical protein